MWLHPYGMKGGGNFSGVCHGKDQAVSLNILHLSPRLSCVFWVFIKSFLKTRECVLTCHGNFIAGEDQKVRCVLCNN